MKLPDASRAALLEGLPKQLGLLVFGRRYLNAGTMEVETA